MTAPLRVALYRNYLEERQPSMRIYADMLVRHLPRAGVVPEEVRPPELVPKALRRSRLAAKVGDFTGRYVAYPLAVSPPQADVHHVVDHGNAHLLGRLGGRAVITCHDLIPLLAARGRLPRDYVGPTARTIFRALSAFLPRARLILAVSQSTKDDLVRELGCDPDRIRVVHLALQDEHLAPRSPEELLEAEVRLRLGPRPRILSVGVNWPHKNLRGVLLTVARLRRRLPRVSLVRVGHPLLPDQRKLADKLGLDGVTHDLGRLPVRDLAAVYRLCDALLFPSYYEGFGWPPLEAMAAGLPVVSSPCGSIPEVSGDAPAYASPDDPEALAEAVLRIVEDPGERARRAELGRSRAASFSWERTVRATAEAYRTVAGA
jgi:glycosyltransferase involved in cell wall biosynthesis